MEIENNERTSYYFHLIVLSYYYHYTQKIKLRALFVAYNSDYLILYFYNPNTSRKKK